MLVLSRESVEEAPTVTAKRSSNPCLKCGIQLPLGEIYCPDCAPMSEDGFDSRSIGPLLVMVGAIALVVVWMAVWLLTPPKGNAASDLTVGPITTEVTR